MAQLKTGHLRGDVRVNGSRAKVRGRAFQERALRGCWQDRQGVQEERPERQVQTEPQGGGGQGQTTQRLLAGRELTWHPKCKRKD